MPSTVQKVRPGSRSDRSEQRLAYRHDDTGPAVPSRPTGTEMGWFALDDPLPFLSMAAARLAPATAKTMRAVAARLRRRV